MKLTPSLPKCNGLYVSILLGGLFSNVIMSRISLYLSSNFNNLCLAGFLYTLGAVPSSLDSLGGLLVLTVI